MTVVTLVELPGFEAAMTTMSAARADEPVRPSPLIQRLFTLRLRPVRAQELRQTEALLELHRILCHRKILLSFRQFHDTAPTGSVADLRQ